MIIEFFGCPGCGKTYAIKRMFNQNPSEIYQNNSIVKKALVRVSKMLLSYSPYAINVRKHLKSVLNRQDMVSVGAIKKISVKQYITNISMLAAIYKYKKDNIYMDEGIFHRIITMCINYGFSKEKCKNLILSISFAVNNIQVYYLKVPIDICMVSIKLRNRREGGIDDMSGDNLMIVLEKYEKYCDFIEENFNINVMSRDKSDERKR